MQSRENSAEPDAFLTTVQRFVREELLPAGGEGGLSAYPVSAGSL